jgi:hypothetical protein
VSHKTTPGVVFDTAAACVFVALALVWTYPLVSHLSTHLPGEAGDNLSFVWNFWWARAALAGGLDPFRTTYLFAPVGVDLTLHTHTALPALVGATVLRSLPVVTAQNLTIIGGLALNGFAAYLLAWRVTNHRGAALAGGVIFAGSPFMSAHLLGHFNLTMAWPIPLFAAIVLSERPGGRVWPILAGLVMGLTAYIDYYFVVYELALFLCLAVLTGRDWSVSLRGPNTRLRPVGILLTVLLAIDLAMIAAIAITGGFRVNVAGIVLSAQSLFNPLQLFWILLAAWLYVRFRPRLVLTATGPRPGFLQAFLILAAVFIVIAAPILSQAAELVSRGEYVTQKYFWRSGPAGVDAASLFLGNPFHGLWGGTIERTYRFFGIDVIESMAWLGVAPLVLAVVAVRRDWRAVTAVRHWTAVGLVFLIWALGPHLTMFGLNTGMILPEALIRYLPVIGNARVPGRAMVVAYLALSVLAAIALARWRDRSRRIVLLLAVAAVIVDFIPAPFTLVGLDRPPAYETLRARPERGAVLELPLGLRDGFGERGFLDPRVLGYQVIHGRPMTGGFVARLPPPVVSFYEKDALLGVLIALSTEIPDQARPLPTAGEAAERLRAHGIAFVLLNRRLAPAKLRQYVESVLPLSVIAQDDERTLYSVNKQ